VNDLDVDARAFGKFDGFVECSIDLISLVAQMGEVESAAFTQ
jgi:hypothetical protein